MTRDEIRATVLRVLGEIAPEAARSVYFRASAAQCYSPPLSKLAISSKQLALPVARSLRSFAVGIVNCQP